MESRTYRYPEAVRDTVGMTPIVMILTEMRHAFIDPSAPSAAAIVRGWLLVPIALSVGVFGLGMLVFNRQAPRAVELL